MTLLQPRGAAVQVPDANTQSSIGLGMRNTTIGATNSMGQPTTVAEKLRAVLGNSLSQTNSTGYNWGQHATNLYEDDALRQLKGGQETNPETDAYFIERVAAAMETFINQIFHKTLSFYEVYKRCREEFRMTINGLPCEVRGTFIDEVSKIHDFTRIVATAGAPFFGKKLIDLLRDGSREQFTQNDYIDSAFYAIRNILSLELINWLMKSSKGREYAIRLPKEIQSRVTNLEAMKEFTGQVFDFFGLTSPYANLEFKIPEVVRPDFNMLYNGVTNYTQNAYQVGGTKSFIEADDHSADEIMQLVRRNANEANNTSNRHSTQVYEEPNYMTWDQVRNDLQNLTTSNKHLFNLGRFFHNIGKTDHYFIEDEVWQRIRHAFRKHSEMGSEETCLPGTFRIVIGDLQNDSGWHSTIVRSDELSMQYVLTNPAKLLPLLEDSTLQGSWDVSNYNLSDKVEKNTLVIEVEECSKLEKGGLPVVTFDKLVESRGSAELHATVDLLNDNISKNFKRANVASFNLATWDTFTCSSKEDKIRIRDDLPFLFKDVKSDNNPSIYEACRKLNAYFSEGIVGGDVAQFIAGHLTGVVNNWLINCAGYSAKPDQFGRALSVDNVLQDMGELAAFLKERDPTSYHWLTQTYEDHYLLESLKIFTLDNPYNKVDEEDVISKAKHELELQVVRNLYIAVINNRQGPHYVDENIPLVIKRSRFPEYFDLVEKSFKSTMAVTGGGNIKTTDKLIKFSEGGGIWLFSYSMVDENVATLRRVNENGTLVLLPLK